MNKFPPIIVGEIFGKLTVIAPAEPYVSPSDGRRRKRWLCQCECGNTTIVGDSKLKYGHTKSCGCLAREKLNILNSKKRKPRGNKYDLDGNYGVGYDSNGDKFYFSLEDYDLIKDYTWCCHKDTYDYVQVGTHINGKQILLSRLLMGASKGEIVDHINGNPTDNRRENLRMCTPLQNAQNRRANANNKSGHKGISKHKNSWAANICCNGKKYSKSFSTNKYSNAYELACEWYDQKAQELFGEYNRVDDYTTF